MSRAPFVFPVFAEDVPRVIHIEGALSLTHEVPVGDVTYIIGAAEDLEAAERTPTHVRLRVKGPVTVDSHTVSVAPDLATFAAPVTEQAERHRPLFAALIAARHEAVLDEFPIASEVTASLWAVAKGTPLDAVTIERLSKQIAFDVEMIDLDRWNSFDWMRALGVLEAALHASPALLVLAAIGARADVYWRDPALLATLDKNVGRGPVRAEKRWLSVVAGALARLDAVDGVAGHVLVCALHRIRPPARARAASPPPRPQPAAKPIPVYVPVPHVPFALQPTRKSEPSPLRTATTTVGSSTLKLTEGEAPPGVWRPFRVELDGVPRRVRVRWTFVEGYDRERIKTESACVIDWIEDDHGRLEDLYTCLVSKDTKRSEADGRLSLSLDHETHFRMRDWYDVSIVIGTTGPIEIDIQHISQNESYY